MCGAVCYRDVLPTLRALNAEQVHGGGALLNGALDTYLDTALDGTHLLRGLMSTQLTGLLKCGLRESPSERPTMEGFVRELARITQKL